MSLKTYNEENIVKAKCYHCPFKKIRLLSLNQDFKVCSCYLTVCSFLQPFVNPVTVCHISYPKSFSYCTLVC